MTLQERVDSLPKDKQFDLAIRLVKETFPIWDNYANKNKLTYQDSVVGMSHTVDRNLIRTTVDAIHRFINTNRINKLIIKKLELLTLSRQFDDPIVSLQDSDWELPLEVQKTFYAVHNLLEAAIGIEKTVFNERTVYVTINQAIDALDSSETLTADQIKNILDEYINGK
jgi:hypothetical protein